MSFDNRGSKKSLLLNPDTAENATA